MRLRQRLFGTGWRINATNFLKNLLEVPASCL
jgi:hypothetical protein